MAFLDIVSNIYLVVTAKYTRRPPCTKTVLKDIRKEGWTANHPSPEDIVAKWKPAPKIMVESDQHLMKLVTAQKWSGLSIKLFPGDKGQSMYNSMICE